MNQHVKHLHLFFWLLIMITATCASQSLVVDQEQAIVGQYSDDAEKKYSIYMVAKDLYTTRGSLLQDKHYKLLIGMVKELVENRKIPIAPGTVGFYFDKKSKNTRRLFLGFDTESGRSFSDELSGDDLDAVIKDLQQIIHTVQSCRSIFSEAEVVGMVVGWRWKTFMGTEFINIWINKGDVFRYEEGRLTPNELLGRSIFTNTSGKIIRTP